jgi:ENTS family enterobactin (siderophore) exporter
MSQEDVRANISDTAGELVAGLPATTVESAGEIRGNVWRIGDFRIVAIGEGISALGDAVSFVALPLLVLALTGSGTAMGIVTALQTLPDLLIGLPAGAYADRWDRRRTMLYADLGRALLTALIPLAVALHLPTMAVVLLVVFPINALRVVFMAAWTAAVPNLVGRALIGPATSYFEAIFALGFILGPAIAGILAASIGPGPTLAIDALSFVASAVALAFVRSSLRESVVREERHLPSRSGKACTTSQGSPRCARRSGTGR